MNMIWGITMAAIGLLMFIGGTTKSQFFVYALLVARARLLWGDDVHRFFQVTGLIIAVLGVLWAAGVIWK
jgi:hypothetical protein